MAECKIAGQTLRTLCGSANEIFLIPDYSEENEHPQVIAEFDTNPKDPEESWAVAAELVKRWNEHPTPTQRIDAANEATILERLLKAAGAVCDTRGMVNNLVDELETQLHYYDTVGKSPEEYQK